MGLPIRTTMEDVRELCGYLVKKPTGATVKEAKAVLDAKRLDGRKLSALKIWQLIDEDDNNRLRVTEAGRKVIKNSGADQVQVLTGIIGEISPYKAIVERAAHRQEESLSAPEVSGHWFDHFKDSVASNEKVLNDQAICFFHLAEGAQLGSLVVGRKGSPTRFDFDKVAVSSFVDLEGSTVETKPYEEQQDDHEGIEDSENSASISTVTGSLSDNGARRNAAPEQLGQGIFVAHGKNKKPLEQLKKILHQFKIPYKVATDEPNLGRPISKKVRETMEACNCAILIFTADEELKDPDGNTIWRPSENVVHELGASGYLYDDRIVIMKESSVNFPSNFADIGYISFEKDKLEAQAMEILSELIGFEIVKIST